MQLVRGLGMFSESTCELGVVFQGCCPSTWEARRGVSLGPKSWRFNMGTSLFKNQNILERHIYM